MTSARGCWRVGAEKNRFLRHCARDEMVADGTGIENRTRAKGDLMPMRGGTPAPAFSGERKTSGYDRFFGRAATPRGQGTSPISAGFQGLAG